MYTFSVVMYMVNVQVLIDCFKLYTSDTIKVTIFMSCQEFTIVICMGIMLTMDVLM